jgi:hypothetical protein
LKPWCCLAWLRFLASVQQLAEAMVPLVRFVQAGAKAYIESRSPGRFREVAGWSGRGLRYRVRALSDAVIEQAGRTLAEKAAAPARVFVFGSHARGMSTTTAISTSSWSRAEISPRRHRRSCACETPCPRSAFQSM